MDVPGVVAKALDGATVHTRVGLEGAGVDALYVADTHTVAYDEEGLLSDESVTTVPHDAERVAVSEGRRKATITLTDGRGDDHSVTVPARQTDEALAPMLAGLLATRGVIDAEESVRRIYRFNELTLVVTSDRVLKHVGGAVWDVSEHETIEYADVREFGIEEGSVSTQLVIETADRQERIKTPADSAKEVHRAIEDALLAYHGVDSYDRFREAVTTEETTEGSTEQSPETGFAESGLDPIDAGDPSPDADSGAAPAEETAGTADAGAAGDTDADGFASSEFESAATRQPPDLEAVEAELRALEEALARQAELIERQRAAVEGLVDELDVD